MTSQIRARARPEEEEEGGLVGANNSRFPLLQRQHVARKMIDIALTFSPITLAALVFHKVKNRAEAVKTRGSSFETKGGVVAEEIS